MFVALVFTSKANINIGLLFIVQNLRHRLELQTLHWKKTLVYQQIEASSIVLVFYIYKVYILFFSKYKYLSFTVYFTKKAEYICKVAWTNHHCSKNKCSIYFLFPRINTYNSYFSVSAASHIVTTNLPTWGRRVVAGEFTRRMEELDVSITSFLIKKLVVDVFQIVIYDCDFSFSGDDFMKLKALCHWLIVFWCGYC